MTCRQHAGVDDMQMTCACRGCAEDVHVTPGVVLHEIWQLRQEDGVQLCIKPNMASLLFLLSEKNLQAVAIFTRNRLCNFSFRGPRTWLQMSFKYLKTIEYKIQVTKNIL